MATPHVAGAAALSTRPGPGEGGGDDILIRQVAPSELAKKKIEPKNNFGL